MPWEPLPGRGSREPTPLRASLDRVARGLGLGSASSLATLFSGWADIVGADVADHSRPLDVRGARVVVAVDDPAWSTQLRLLEPMIVERIHEATGETSITGLALRVQPL